MNPNSCSRLFIVVILLRILFLLLQRSFIRRMHRLPEWNALLIPICEICEIGGCPLALVYGCASRPSLSGPDDRGNARHPCAGPKVRRCNHVNSRHLLRLIWQAGLSGGPYNRVVREGTMDFETLPRFRAGDSGTECDVLIHEGPVTPRDCMFLCALAVLLLLIQITLLALEGIPAVLITIA